jgi:ribosome-associated translation inhibitor RaiA
LWQGIILSKTVAMKTNKFFAIVIFCLLPAGIVIAQDSIINSNKISNKYYHSLEKKATKLQERLTKQSTKALQSLQEQENKIYTALHKIDSFKVKELMGNSTDAYTALQQKITDKTKKLTAPFSGSYIASLDSMTGVLGFLKSQGLVPPPGAVGAVKGLSSTLNQAEAIKKFIKEREGQLKTITAQYKDLPASITKSLGKYNKELYYYSQQIQEVKATLKDPAKIEAAVLKYLQKVPAFKKWMQQNGQLAQIFGSGSSPLGEAGGRPSLAGLQTTAGLQQLIQSRLGSSSPTGGGGGFINGQLQTAMNNLQQQRTRLQNALRSGQAGGTGSSSDVMPDFTPNGQKTKTFWKRLEKGYNLQATQRRGQFPSVNDLGLSVGYKVNDKSVIGIGMSYKFGLGESFNKIKWTSEGIGLRSFIDLKWKGNLWISGGYEQHYWQRFTLLSPAGGRAVVF